MRRALPALALLACGDGDAIILAHPEIHVCAPSGACDVDFELGERHRGVKARIDLLIVNRGDGPLTVSAISGTAELSPLTRTATVGAGRSAPLELELVPAALGPGAGAIELSSDDPTHPRHRTTLSWTGTPRPEPRIELCAETRCGTDIDLDFGVVRRSQTDSRVIRVRNTGTAPLALDGARLSSMSSMPGELRIGTSTAAGTLAAGAEAPVLILYAPADGAPDSATLEVRSDDPRAPSAFARIRATSEANAPPIAVVEIRTSTRVLAGDRVVVDGRRSSDPEGDPLLFRWRIVSPAGAAATADAPAVSFTAGAAGEHRAELVVVDSLGQASPPATASVLAAPRDRLRVTIDWSTGGDVDLHLVPAGEALFSSADCHFDNPAPNLFDRSSARDDPVLTADSTVAPGRESIRIEAPATGRYEVYAHYFEGPDPAEVHVQVVLDNAASPVFEERRTLGAACDLWLVGAVQFPPGRFEAGPPGLSRICR